MVKPFEYRREATNLCPYPLMLTPDIHYVSGGHKIIEMILINNFGRKNLPECIWWRQSDPNTPTKVFNFQKSYWPTVKRILKSYSAEIVMAMVERNKIKFLSPKLIPKYLYWCKLAQQDMKKVKHAESRYNKEETVLEDKPVIDIEKKDDDNLRDWLDD